MDPLSIAGFTFMHLVLLSSLVGLVMPRWFNVLVPSAKITEGDYPVLPGAIFSRANATGTLDIDGVPQTPEDSAIEAREPSDEETWAQNRSSQEKVADKRQ